MRSVCEQACRGSINKNCVAHMNVWLASGHSVMLRATCSECLVFRVCSETIPTKVPWLFSVLFDKHWVRVFLKKWHKAGLANMRDSRKVCAALGQLNSVSNTV